MTTYRRKSSWRVIVGVALIPLALCCCGFPTFVLWSKYDYGKIEGLVNAGCEGDIPAARRYLDAGVPINARDNEGYAAAECALFNVHRETVEFLIQRGASPDVAKVAVRHGIRVSATGTPLEKYYAEIDRRLKRRDRERANSQSPSRPR